MESRNTIYDEQGNHQYGDAIIKDHAVAIFGNITNFGSFSPSQPDAMSQFGLCLGSAPEINPGKFVGRTTEMETMSAILCPDAICWKQRRLVLGGMGGIGKTQLAIAYAHRDQSEYDSVFWLNASSKLDLQASFRLITAQLVAPQELEKMDDEQVLVQAHKWLSDTRNKRWLLIFDNYDEPDQFDVTHYCPYVGHGSILVTTRLPDRIRLSREQLYVQCFRNVEDGLDILQKRSSRSNVKNDLDAHRLTERMAGFPLALATAGAYLSKSASTTFAQYLQAYEERWYIDPRRPLHLQEYQDRTLYTTWNLTYSQLQIEDPVAAKALKLLAYFENQAIWYELLHAGLDDTSPDWLKEILADTISFDSVMRTLIDYCLVETPSAARLYSIHNCVHDWILAGLNERIDPKLYWYAVGCVAAHIDKDDQESLAELKYARLVNHAMHCAHHRFLQSSVIDLVTPASSDGLVLISALLKHQRQGSVAEQILGQLLVQREQVLGFNNASTLDVFFHLAQLYRTDKKFDNAEQMFQRGLVGSKEALGPNHATTLKMMGGLGTVYLEQKNFDRAEQMLQQTMAALETSAGHEYYLSPVNANNLAAMHLLKRNYQKAEEMLLHVIAMMEKVRPDHSVVLLALHNLGLVYYKQNRFCEAERTLLRALAGREKVLEPNHKRTLDTVINLGNLFYAQGNLDEAERLYRRAMVGYQQLLGLEDARTQDVVKVLERISRKRKPCLPSTE